jgi:DNA modification methylase
MTNQIYHGKMEDVLKDFPDNFCDSVVTDPPYGLSFMGKHWDYDVPTVEQWKEAFRVLKPGGFLLAFGGTRTYHRMVVNIEDAGFEIRDQIQWLYGSGFPKSLDISKAIDKQAGAEREYVGEKIRIGDKKTYPLNSVFENHTCYGEYGQSMAITAPATDAAKQWEGYGTALKPANEPICVARKPVEGTVAENVLKYGTGGLNIDGCRIEVDKNIDASQLRTMNRSKKENNGWGMNSSESDTPNVINEKGRFPANVILDEFMGAELDKQTGNLKSGEPCGVKKAKNNIYGEYGTGIDITGYGDEGGASRFFYCPKPDAFERNKGLKNFEAKEGCGSYEFRVDGSLDGSKTRPKRNHHPTVKPIDLMRYLVRLVTPKGGICLDPFCGSGTTLIAAKMELMNYIGIDMDESHIPLAEARVKNWNPDLYKPQQLFD